MAWYDEMVPLLRTLIDDSGPTTTYDDSSLEDILVSSAHFVVQELDLMSTYTISISGHTISPDPTGTNDTIFINLVCLKAACLVLKAEEKQAVLGGIRVHDGPSIIDTTKRVDYYAKIAGQECFNYDQLKTQYLLGNSSAGHVVVSGGTFQYANESELFI